MESSDKGNGCVWAFFILLGLVLFVTFASVNSGESEDGGNDRADACVIAQRFVRLQLKAPSTARFPPCIDMSITRNYNKWTVVSYVDAQNSFGAMLRNSFVAEVEYRPDLNEWRAIDVQILSP